jgi:spore germination cell wall hydrolase CwlJ-like protein
MKVHLKELLKHLLYYTIFLVITSTAVIVYQDYKVEQQAETIRKERQEQMKAKEKNCIKAALWHEARGEGEHGILAVASVIENRLKHPNYPSTYCAVINQRKQFSYTLDNKPTGERLEASIKTSEQPMYSKVALTADSMVEGQFEPILEHSVLWYAHKKIKNAWIKTKKTYATIGNHRFYKE